MATRSAQSLRALARWIARRGERAASLVEYALLIALIAVVMVGAVEVLGGSARSSLDRSNASISAATTR